MRIFRAALAAFVLAAAVLAGNGIASAQIAPAFPNATTASLTTACVTSTGCASTAVAAITIAPGTNVQAAVSGGTGVTGVFESSVDCVNYTPIQTYSGTSVSYNGQPTGKCFQFRVSAIASGTVAVTLIPSPGSFSTTTVSPASGQVFTLASAVAATTNQAWTSPFLGFPKQVTICLSTSGATTFTVTESPDAGLFYASTLADTTTTGNYVAAGAGTQCESLTPNAYVRVATSAAVTVSAQVFLNY